VIDGCRSMSRSCSLLQLTTNAGQMCVVMSQDWKQKPAVNRDQSPSVPAELLSVNNGGCLCDSGAEFLRNTQRFCTSYCRRFRHQFLSVCWDARRWLVVDSLTSPTHAGSLSCSCRGLDQRSSSTTSCASRQDSRTPATLLGDREFSSFGIESEFPAAFVGRVVMP
jgi:hypothetical protein